MTDAFNLVDTLVLCGALVVSVWVGLNVIRSSGKSMLPAAAKIAMVTWVAAFGFALYLISG